MISFLFPKKRGDKVIAAVILLTAAALLAANFFLQMNCDSANAEIVVDGKLVQKIALDGEHEYKIENAGGYNIIKTEKGAAYIVSSDCADKTCVKMGRISRGGSASICLPHKVVLRICKNSEVDAVSQ